MLLHHGFVVFTTEQIIVYIGWLVYKLYTPESRLFISKYNLYMEKNYAVNRKVVK